ncbi:hypothetical protein [Tichowtungia aerotolerans]|uniref:Uncharacterized protein n=1 Tax=Tichowtungia aerotolerans TaxID=2697043 RepID=A0A6P1M9V7_9BACT|nr:hypothetical protein [Tichowtungia aerotolerans]QHI69334.1 hypothetical protein GT409_07675 [Tichowtungia aerotolerans]
MHTIRFVLIILTLGFYSIAAEVSEEVEGLQEKFQYTMKVWAVEDDNIETDNGDEYFVLEFESQQPNLMKIIEQSEFFFGSQHPLRTQIEGQEGLFEMRVTVQLTDKKTKAVGYAQSFDEPLPLKFTENTIGNYADHTAWEYRIPFGNMKKPKLSAYAIEFGLLKDGKFISIATEYKKVEDSEEILSAGGDELQMECYKCSHYYWDTR